MLTATRCLTHVLGDYVSITMDVSAKEATADGYATTWTKLQAVQPSMHLPLAGPLMASGTQKLASETSGTY